uniref:EF-hand domain-containing protein n=1 Tax=Panagrellus redivivus TaxID=6233 RepID=A0A7E4ZYB5_PANRE
MEMDLLTENQALKAQINDLKSNLEAERNARAETDRHHAELVAIYRSTIDWCEKERSAHLEHIQLLEKQIEDNKTNSLQERLEALEKLAITLESRKFEWSGTRVQNREVDDRDSSEKCSENVTLDPPTVNDDCQESSAAEPSSSNKSEGSAVIKLGLNMLLSGQRKMNLEGIMSLYTEFHAKEDFDDADDGWKKYFVEVVTCELDGKLDNVSAVAQRLMNNVHIEQFQDPVEGVHVEKSQFDKEELKCLELICDALCIDFKAS